MPGRLTTIFDRHKTKVEDRYTKIAACSYSNDALVEAERFAIFPDSSYVADDEGLARIIECPNAIRANGQFHALAFQEAMKRGLSTQRVNFIANEAIHKFGNWKADTFNKKNTSREPRNYLGFIVATAGDVRKLTNDCGGRFFGVFATPENNPEHADIFLITAVDEGDKLHIQRLFHHIFKVGDIVRAPA